MEEGVLHKAAKFTGKDMDEDTGLYYFNARWYDQEVGRFVSKDDYNGSIGSPASQNKFIFVVNNPLKYVDLDGHKPSDSSESKRESENKIGDFFEKTALAIGGNGFKTVDELKGEGVEWANWENELNENVANRISTIDPNYPVELQNIIKSIIFNQEVDKLRAKYGGLNAAVSAPFTPLWNKPIRDHLAPLFSQDNEETYVKIFLGGAHNMDEFMKNNVNIVQKTKHPKVNGIYEIEYQIPALDSKT